MRILLGAWACNPREGSESAVGWSWLRAIRREHEVHVLTALYQRDWIEAEVSRQPEEFSRVHFHYAEPPLWQYRKSRFWLWQANILFLVPLFHRYYHRWMLAAYKAAQELNERFHFDLAHQLTFVGFRFPGHLWRLGIPFVWGPIGGLENTPWRLLPEMGARGAIYYAARNVMNTAHKRFLRAPRKAFARAGAVIAATSRIQAEILKWYGVPSEVICEVGTPFEPRSEFALRARGEPLRIAWSGLHLPRKALPLLLRALRAMPGAWYLDIYGDGPCRNRWRALACALGIQDRCAWHGQVPREAALEGLRRAHLFVTTSLKDLTSTVIIEALASGVPVLCPDHCGFSDAITAECGVKIPIPSVAEFEKGLRGALLELYRDEERRRRLAAGALRRARDYSWEAKAGAIERVYRRALASRSAPSRLSIAAPSPAKDGLEQSVEDLPQVAKPLRCGAGDLAREPLDS